VATTSRLPHPRVIGRPALAAPAPPAALAPGGAVEVQHDDDVVREHQRLDAPAQAAERERHHGRAQLGRGADVAAALVEAHADLEPIDADRDAHGRARSSSRAGTMRCASSSTSSASATCSIATARRDAAQSLDAAFTTATTQLGMLLREPGADLSSFPSLRAYRAGNMGGRFRDDFAISGRPWGMYGGTRAQQAKDRELIESLRRRSEEQSQGLFVPCSRGNEAGCNQSPCIWPHKCSTMLCIRHPPGWGIRAGRFFLPCCLLSLLSE
jgi:hypothetical protein